MTYFDLKNLLISVMYDNQLGFMLIMYFAMKDTNKRNKICKPINKYRHTKDDALAFLRATLLVFVNSIVSLGLYSRNWVASRHGSPLPLGNCSGEEQVRSVSEFSYRRDGFSRNPGQLSKDDAT
jgi:hypothetical protein